MSVFWSQSKKGRVLCDNSVVFLNQVAFPKIREPSKIK